MELVYLWIEKYGCLTLTGFHFTHSFKVEYNKEVSTLTIAGSSTETAERLLFQGNITNLSVIVGDNGAGKTSLLRGVIDFLATYEEHGLLESFVGVFYDRDLAELNIYSFNIPKVIVLSDECKTTAVNIMDINGFREKIKKTKIIYINNVLDLHDYSYRKLGHVVDASIGGLIRSDYLNSKEKYHIDSNENPVLNYYNNEVYRQLSFIYEYKPNEKDSIIPFRLPEDLKVSVLRSGDRFNDVIGDLEKHNRAQYDSENITSERQEETKRILNLVHMINNPEWIQRIDRKQRWLFRLVEHLLLNAIVEVVRPNTTSDRRDKELTCLFQAYQTYQGDEPLIPFVRAYLDRTKKKLDQESIFSDMLIPYQDFLQWLDNNNLFEFELDNIENDVIWIKLNKHNKDSFQEFFSHYNKTCHGFYYLNFSWGLSTGENNLLSLYSRLYSVLEANPRGGSTRGVINHFAPDVKCNNVLLLIDEADLSYHPKWQIRYVDVLLEIVADLYRDCQVQIIMTTHSPILLSDVPKGNVIYLKNGKDDSFNKHKETFGQNIHTLFTDAFFLHKSIGDFSGRIIKEVGNDLEELAKGSRKQNKKFSRKLKYYKSITSIIGEPVIRKAFEFKLEEVEAGYQTERLKGAINLYNDLSPEDRDSLIEYIIRTSELGTNYEED